MQLNFNNRQFSIRQNSEGLYSLKDIEHIWKESGGRGKALRHWKDSPQFKTLNLRENFKVDNIIGGDIEKQGTWGSEFAIRKYLEYLKGVAPRHHQCAIREDAALKTIEQLLNIKLIRQYPVGNYFIDGYDYENNIAYEIDEEHHRFQQDADNERQEFIMDQLDCTFVRIKL